MKYCGSNIRIRNPSVQEVVHPDLEVLRTDAMRLRRTSHIITAKFLLKSPWLPFPQYHRISKNCYSTGKVRDMLEFKRLLVFLTPSVQLVMSTPSDTPNLFRRQCPGDALTVLEGSTCDMSQADTLACSDNCFDIVSHTHSRASHQLTVCSFNAVNNLPIQIRG